MRRYHHHHGSMFFTGTVDDRLYENILLCVDLLTRNSSSVVCCCCCGGQLQCSIGNVHSGSFAFLPFDHNFFLHVRDLLLCSILGSKLRFLRSKHKKGNQMRNVYYSTMLQIPHLQNLGQDGSRCLADGLTVSESKYLGGKTFFRSALHLVALKSLFTVTKYQR